MGMRAIWETLYLPKVIVFRHVVIVWRKEGRQPREALARSRTTYKQGKVSWCKFSPVWVPAAQLQCGSGGRCQGRWL